LKTYTIRKAKPEEQRELTQLVVRATMHAGYDEDFIARSMPGLTITLPTITAGDIQVAELPGEIIGVVQVMNSELRGIAVLGIYVDPPHWGKGVGRALFEAAVVHARTLKAGAVMIYALPNAEGFYGRLGAIRIGESPFYFSPEVMSPHFLFIVPPAGENSN
jgi:GNAT superfamily N-acetyltransferase